MFHTPPADAAKTTWLHNESRKHSYSTDPHAINSTTSVPVTMAIDSDIETPTSVAPTLSDADIVSIQKEVENIIKVPTELSKLIDEFIQYLKEPRYQQPLKPVQVAQLFQNFYPTYDNKIVTYSKRVLNFTSNSSSNLIQLKSNNETLDTLKLTLRLNLTVIRYWTLSNSYLFEFSQDGFQLYKKIFKNSKSDKYTQDKLKNKLTLVKYLDIPLKTYMDAENEITDAFNKLDNQKAYFDEFSTLFNSINSKKNPNEKLSIVLSSQKVLIKKLSDLCGSHASINNDVLIPVLIYLLINHDIDNLYLNLMFIKRFTNNIDNYINYKNLDTRSINYIDSYLNKGELLFALTNYEAVITFLINFTIPDLSIELTETQLLNLDEEEQSLLLASITIPIEEDDSRDSSLAPSKKSRSRSSSVNSNNQKSFYTLPSDLADSGMKTIGLAFDSSVKNIIGRLPFKSSTYHESSMAGIISNTTTSGSDTASNTPPISVIPPTVIESIPTNDSNVSSSSSHDESQNTFNKFTNGMSEVMKSFRPSLSSSSLSQEAGELNINTAIKSPRKNRSRATSLQIFDKFNRPAAPRISFSPEKSRSTSSANLNSYLEDEKTELVAPISNDADDDGELKALMKFDGIQFESLTMGELKELVKSYQGLINIIKKA